MKSYGLLIALLYGISLRASALQGNTPQAALEELATTNKPEVIARHLPEPVQKSIEVLPKPQKQQFMDKLLSIKTLQLDGCTIRRATDGDAWDIVDSEGASKGKVKLANAFISGVDAMLPLQVESEDGSQVFIVSMHLEGDDWRIDDFGPWQKADLGLAKLVHQLTEMEKNEAAAQETLARMVRALNNYAAMFPQLGYPSSLRAFTPTSDESSPIWRLLLLDESFTADPLTRDGYQFRYLQTAAGSGDRENPGGFEITATPVEFGKTGTKSFFINENGRIRGTAQNRPATADDPQPDD